MRKFQQEIIYQNIDNGTGGYFNGFRFVPYPEDHFKPHGYKSSFLTAEKAIDFVKKEINRESDFSYVLEATVTDKETGEVLYHYIKK